MKWWKKLFFWRKPSGFYRPLLPRPVAGPPTKAEGVVGPRWGYRPPSVFDARVYTLSVAERETLFATFTERHVDGPCAACGHRSFALQANLAKIAVGQNEITPCVAVACERCGLIRYHSALILGVATLRIEP